MKRSSPDPWPPPGLSAPTCHARNDAETEPVEHLAARSEREVLARRTDMGKLIALAGKSARQTLGTAVLGRRRREAERSRT